MEAAKRRQDVPSWLVSGMEAQKLALRLRLRDDCKALEPRQ
jgi:hypothetical protein